ncbi:MAG: [Fe-Fe] hydrogenase large subunit C-terminal domain-containing protein, partial [Thermoguttaceae bacterium]|nr:[Fe-Fe] hydrogenase large subunit C-terminal domain-containing protein [Thermoguttaceae bacterium]
MKNNRKKHEVSTRRDILKTGLCSLGATLLPLADVRGQGYGRGRGGEGPLNFDPNSPAIAFNPNRCERCGDCRTFCQGVTTVQGWTGPEVAYPCISCGQCTLICQGRAVTEKFSYPEVAGILQLNQKICVASVAPSLRVSLGEMFGLMPGTNVESKLIQGLRQCGFKYVFDTSFAADVVVMEEAAELVRRLNDSSAKLPLFTSCCPAWIRFAELFYPNVLPHLSTVKSPFLV